MCRANTSCSLWVDAAHRPGRTAAGRARQASQLSSSSSRICCNVNAKVSCSCSLHGGLGLWCCLLLLCWHHQLSLCSARQLPEQQAQLGSAAVAATAWGNKQGLGVQPAITDLQVAGSTQLQDRPLTAQHQNPSMPAHLQDTGNTQHALEGGVLVSLDAGGPSSVLSQQAQAAGSAAAEHQQGQHDPDHAAWLQLIHSDIARWRRLQSAQRHLNMRVVQQQLLLPMQEPGADAADADMQTSSSAQQEAEEPGVNEAADAVPDAASDGNAQPDSQLASAPAAPAGPGMAGVPAGPPPSAPEPLTSGPQHSPAFLQVGPGAASTADQQAAATASAAVQAAVPSARGDVDGFIDIDGADMAGFDSGAVAVMRSSTDGGSSQGAAAEEPWSPQVLAAPVPKYPRLYAPLPMSPTTIIGPAARAAAREALAQALQGNKASQVGIQNITFDGIIGLALEDKVLLARLLGHPVRGDFDEAGRLDPDSKQYWELLDKQLESHSIVKHMFEPTWYKCRKLQPDLGERPASVDDLEQEALGHILHWLDLQEHLLPLRGESASFDELVAVLRAVGAAARLVTDPVPFLTTSHTPLDRNGMPLLIHMTFKDKGRFSRHHLLAIASWARENPDHAILLYDDADLLAYMSLFDVSALDLYRSLKTAVERSDLWRYSVMCKHGGVYTDADTLCVRPIQEWNRESSNDAEVLFGVEDVFKRNPAGGGTGWGVTSGRIGIQYEQWTLAGAPSHPVYCKMPDFIKQRMSDEAIQEQPQWPSVDAENWLILHRTGPHVWTDSVLQWMQGAGMGFHEALVQGGKLVYSNTRVMPAETFGCPAHFFSPTAHLQDVYAMHMFRGVWRKRLDVEAQAQLRQGTVQV